VGEISRGKMTYPGTEHLDWEARIDAMEPERRFALTWVPYSDPQASFDEGIHTHVEFLLEPTTGGTRLKIVETGFENLPDYPRWQNAFRMNAQGWDEQVRHIGQHVDS
jgi:uncharacterized protein YndB with AHSA1/START domain